MLVDGGVRVQTLLADTVISALYAFQMIVQGPSGVSLLTCALAGAVIRTYNDREATAVLGNLAVALIFLVDSFLIGFLVARDPFFANYYPATYLVVVTPAICWAIHVPLGMLAMRLGARAFEYVDTHAHHR
jgi:hypothetical protein